MLTVPTIAIRMANRAWDNAKECGTQPVVQADKTGWITDIYEKDTVSARSCIHRGGRRQFMTLLRTSDPQVDSKKSVSSVEF